MAEADSVPAPVANGMPPVPHPSTHTPPAHAIGPADDTQPATSGSSSSSSGRPVSDAAASTSGQPAPASAADNGMLGFVSVSGGGPPPPYRSLNHYSPLPVASKPPPDRRADESRLPAGDRAAPTASPESATAPPRAAGHGDVTRDDVTAAPSAPRGEAPAASSSSYRRIYPTTGPHDDEFLQRTDHNQNRNVGDCKGVEMVQFPGDKPSNPEPEGSLAETRGLAAEGGELKGKSAGSGGGGTAAGGPPGAQAPGEGGGEDQVKVEECELEKNLTPVRQLLSLWYVAVIVLTPIVLLPLPLVINTQEAKCAYVIFVMAVFWVTEAIPIPVTSLMPIFLLPMMGLVTARNTSAAYINDTSILFLGGLTVAIAIERWNLHRRIALAVMLVVGAEPRWLMLGMMSVTWFLSMWISNTATTAMMLPIVSAVLQQISSAEDAGDEGGDGCHHDDDAECLDVKVTPLVAEVPDEKPEEKQTRGGLKGLSNRVKKYKLGNSEGGNSTSATPSTEGGGAGGGARSGGGSHKQLSITKLRKALSLAIAYSANVGGIGSLTGTGPNLVLLGQSQIIFEKVGLNTPISFATWLVYGLPLSFVVVIVVWIWLQIFFLRCRGGCDCILRRGQGSAASDRNSKVREVIRGEFKKLGPVTFAEGTIIVFFALLVILWITRDLGGVGGWGDIFEDGFVSDSTPAILTAVLMFLLPSSLPDIFFRRKRQSEGPRKALQPLLNWKILHDKMPWSLYLLLGGGFAIARAAQDSGLSLWLGEKLAVFGALDPWVMLLIICYIITFITEVTSNTAIATIMMPIMAQLSLTLRVNPLFFMFPVAITTSFAFMLPVATPPNAIVFAFGAVRVIDMASCGFMLNVMSVPLLILASITVGNAFFHFDVVPPEFLNNATAIASNVTAV